MVSKIVNKCIHILINMIYTKIEDSALEIRYVSFSFANCTNINVWSFYVTSTSCKSIWDTERLSPDFYLYFHWSSVFSLVCKCYKSHEINTFFLKNKVKHVRARTPTFPFCCSSTFFVFLLCSSHPAHLVQPPPLSLIPSSQLSVTRRRWRGGKRHWLKTHSPSKRCTASNEAWWGTARHPEPKKATNTARCQLKLKSGSQWSRVKPESQQCPMQKQVILTW